MPREQSFRMLRILVTRPLEDGREIAALLAARGHQPMLAPLLESRFHEGSPLEEQGLLNYMQAVPATSANGVRALARRTARRDLALFAVGPQTAEAARRAGFQTVKSADGDAKTLADAASGWAEAGAPLLHVCADDAPGNLAEDLDRRGFTVRRLPLYAIEPATRLPEQAQTALREGALDGVMLFSPRTAQLF